MIRKLNTLIIAFCIFIFASCNNGVSEKSKLDTTVDNSSNKSDLGIGIALNRIWVGYQFTDDEAQQFPNRIEQSLVDYIDQFSKYHNDELKLSLDSLIRKSSASKLFFDFIKDKFSLYLYHPNSPMRNDLYYEQVLKAYIESNKLADGDKKRYEILLELVSKNQVGTVVASTSFIVDKDVESSIEKYNANYKLLIFYDPTCVHCKEVISEMKESKVLNTWLDAKKIIVIAIDPINDYEKWKSYQKEMPKSWINGFDHTNSIMKRSLFNIQAYPTIYLLNKDNVVVLKDEPFGVVEEMLTRDFL